MKEPDHEFQELLQRAAAFHGHLCGGQVLGVRMAVAGLRELGIEEPRGEAGRDLVIFVEIDRCAVDAIITVTGRTPGKRSIKMVDHGKMAATFVDTRCGKAVRVSVRGDSNARIEQIARVQFGRMAEGECRLAALQSIAEADLFKIERVRVPIGSGDLPGKLLYTVTCNKCGETVCDGREVAVQGEILCRPCASGKDYYEVLSAAAPGDDANPLGEPERSHDGAASH